ncbi:hypothetical protein Bca52824_009633 [Brassica carinata]|uniref:Uncharacterized protein n=1 Tax=Brassica carinata TaxID=52824 RepID=A0A8X8B9A7_BRACI|nr:hypothetical protein Bca52824_009633 [Brassica carinata]
MVAAAHTFLSFSLPPPFASFASSSFGISLNLHRRQCVSFSSSRNHYSGFIGGYRCVCGNSMSGVVTLTQEDTGPFSILILDV